MSEIRLVKCTPEEIKYLDGVMGQLSDGIWENSQAMEPYWMCNRLINGGIEMQPFTPIYCSRKPFGRSNPLYDKSDAEVRAWFARKLKAVVKTFLEDENLPADEWNRVNEREVHYLRIDQTVAGAYRVYDSLMGRESKSGKQVKINHVDFAKNVRVGDIIEGRRVVKVIQPLTCKDNIVTIVNDNDDVQRINAGVTLQITSIKTVM